MSQEFNSVKIATNKRNSFDMSHHQVTTSDFGKLIPIAMREVIPGDHWEIDPKVFIRLFPLAAPTYGFIKVRVHTFFVPNRIMWKEWNNFIDGKSQSLPPYMLASHMCQWLATEKNFDSSNTNPRGLYSDLMSNLGLAPSNLIRHPRGSETGAWYLNLPSDIKINAFPYLAYHRIWFDYFRDANLNQDEDWFNQFTSSSQMSATQTGYLMARHDACFKKDYFTTAKLKAQEGDPAQATGTFNLSPSASYTGTNVNVAANFFAGNNTANLATGGSGQYGISNMISVAMMRLATAYQRYKERNNYVGSRHLDRIFANYGVKPTAERLDMAEYVGGYDFPVTIGDVTSTSQYAVQSPWGLSGLGTQAGRGQANSFDDNHTVSYNATEHGILMSVMSILPDTGYYQGIHRLWTRGFNGDGHLEYYNQNFENLGYQEIRNRELYVPWDDQYSNYNPDQVWGFSPRYSDMKFQPDVLGGDFISEDTRSGADSFHLFRKLHYTNAQPLSLNENFTTCHNASNDFDRIFQVTSNELDHFRCDIKVNAKATRNMADFAEPSIADVQESEGHTVQLPYGGTRL